MHPQVFTEVAPGSGETSEDGLGGRTIINFGPQHPATHGTLRIILEVEGELIKKATPEIGFLHTGFEKLGEHLSFTQFITLSDRMNYMSAIANNVGFAVAVEELVGVEVPRRAQVLRTIMAEITRIADHVLCVGLQAMDMGAFSVMLWGFKEREDIYDIIEAVCGARLTTSWTRIGGIMRDVPADFHAMISDFLRNFPNTLSDMERMLDRNRIWQIRVNDVGVIPKEMALRYSATGPILRASGVPYDVRKTRPYLIYDELEFDIPTEKKGDCWARYKQRCNEMRESLRIIRQCLDLLEPGPVNLQNHKFSLPEKGDVYSDMESLIHHFEGVMWGHGMRPAREREYYSCTESPTGELGFYLLTDSQGTPKPYRVRVRPPSFINYTLLPELVEGTQIPDLVAVLATLNVIAGELDR